MPRISAERGATPLPPPDDMARKRARRTDLLLCALLALVAVLCHARYILTPGLLFTTEGDSFRQILPTEALLQSARIAGNPFWSFSFGLGGDMFTELTYAGSVSLFSWLRTLLQWLTGGAATDLFASLGWKLGFSIVKLTLAMTLTYALARQNGARPAYACIAALVYGCAPWYLYRAVLFDFMTEAYTLLPLTALCYGRYRRTGQWIPLCLAVALMIGNNFYFGYICCCFFAVYFLVFSIHDRREPSCALTKPGFAPYCARVGKLIGVCLLAAAAAGIALLPSLDGLLSSDRTFADVSIRFLPTWDELKEWIPLVFFGSGKLGLPLLIPLAATVDFRTLSSDARKRSLLAAFWFAMLLCPAAASALNGFSYPTPRWHFLTIFAVAIALPDWLEALTTQGRVRPWHAAAVCAAFVALYALLGDRTVSAAGAAWLLSLLLGCAAVLLVGFDARVRRTKLARYAPALLAALIGAAGMLNAVSVRAHNIYAEDAETLFYGSAGQKRTNLAVMPGGDAFYRVHDLGTDDTNGEDRPYLYGTYGTSNFASEVNGRLSVWLKKTMGFRTSPICAGIYKSFDNRLFADTVWAVRYKVPDPARDTALPSYWTERTTADGDTVYENTLPTGFTLWYDTAAPMSLWDGASFAERDALLLQTAASDDLTGTYPAPSLDMATETLPLTARDATLSGGAWQSDGTLLVPETATLTFPVPAYGEEGEWLLQLEIRETSGEAMFSMTADGVSTEKFADTPESESLNYPLSAYAFRFSGGETALTLTLTCGVYAIDALSVSRNSYAFAEEWAAARHAVEPTELTVDGGSISMRIENAESGVLALSMPYREGWRCIVDGEETPLALVNGIFPGVELAPGAHEIRLRYLPPTLWPGAAATAAAIMLLVALAVIRRRREPCNPSKT